MRLVLYLAKFARSDLNANTDIEGSMGDSNGKKSITHDSGRVGDGASGRRMERMRWLCDNADEPQVVATTTW